MTYRGYMKKIILISCVSQKLDTPNKAENLYTSSLFKYNLKYAKKLNPDKILILSAKYGVVELDQIIEPYDLTLNNMKIGDIKTWASNVLIQLNKYADIENDEFIFLAGEKYRKYLLNHLRKFIIPFEGLKIGYQLQKLKELTL